MPQWAFWIILSVIFGFVEIISPTFFFFWFALGALASGVVSLFIESFTLNIAIFIIVSLLLWISTRKIVSKWYKNSSPNKLYLDTLEGREGVIKAIDDDGKMIVNIKGDQWRAYKKDSSQELNIGDKIKVTKKSGNIIYVEKIDRGE
jgi:membrane protein implicated in regulation of membrane protease activity